MHIQKCLAKRKMQIDIMLSTYVIAFNKLGNVPVFAVQGFHLQTVKQIVQIITHCIGDAFNV